jgi:hypothetical protein
MAAAGGGGGPRRNGDGDANSGIRGKTGTRGGF